MRSVLISDFGGVLTTPLQEGFLAYQEESGVSLEELGKAMGLAAEEHGDHPLFVLERGEITETEFRDRIERHLEDGFDLARLRALYFERLAPNQEMIDFIRDLRRRGLRAALLTNNVREWEPLWRAKLPELDELFELVVDSAFVGLRKPDPEIYTLTLERLGGVRADECVFVDDLERTARRRGRSAWPRCASCLPSRRSRRSSQRCGARSAVSVARIAARERSSLRRWCARSPSQAVQADAATSAASSTPRSLCSTFSSSGRNTRSTSRAFCLRVLWSQPDTTSDSGSSSSAARRTGVTVSSRRPRCDSEGLDPLWQRQRHVDGVERGHDALVLLNRNGLVERLAVGEVLEQRALGDAGARGDPLGGRLDLPLVEEREQGIHERLPGALGADRTAVALPLCRRLHVATLGFSPQRARSFESGP